MKISARLRAQYRIDYGAVLLYDMHCGDPGDEAPVLMQLIPEDAQVLLEDLWNAGIRPREIGTAGHLAATQEHLKHVTRLLDQALPLALRK